MTALSRTLGATGVEKYGQRIQKRSPILYEEIICDNFTK